MRRRRNAGAIKIMLHFVVCEVLVVFATILVTVHADGEVLESASDLYDCHPKDMASRLGLECDVEGDKNAMLMAVAVARCRNEDWKLDWKCKADTVAEVRECMKHEPTASVFTDLVKSYFDVFRWCATDGGSALDGLAAVARGVRDAADEVKRTRMEHEALVEKIATDAKMAAVHAREAAEAARIATEEGHGAAKLTKSLNSAILALREEAYNIENEGLDDMVTEALKQLHSEIDSARTKERKRKLREAKQPFNEFIMLAILLWITASIALPIRQSRTIDAAFDLSVFVVIFCFTMLLKNAWVKIGLRVLFTLIYFFAV